MPSLRHVGPNDKICALIDMNVFEACFPATLIADIFGVPSHQQTKRRPRRVRQCTRLSIILFQCCCSYWRRSCQQQVWKKLVDGLMDLHPTMREHHMSAQALAAQRARLGSDPFRQLLERACRPLGDALTTPSAFYQGLRVMAIDGTLFNVADTPANDAAFGRSSNQYGKGAYPQVRAVMLMECASHAVIAAALGGYHWAEAHGVREVMRSVVQGMLVLGDCGIFSGMLAQEAREKNAHVLCGLSRTSLRHRHTELSDGSYLAILNPNRKATYRATEKQTVRVIEYTLTDERLGKPGRLYRLVTTLLDEKASPSHELIELYQQRWEVELMIRELKSVLHEQVKVLRAKKPDGVKQEVYALLLAHYNLRFWMVKAGEQAGIDPCRLSCKHALEELRLRVERVATWSQQHREPLLDRMIQEMSTHVLPAPILRNNRREIKQVYNKHKPKKRGKPAPAPFEKTDTYLSFVVIHVREMGTQDASLPDTKSA
ncbi:transposase [Dictyobacter alpinus]|uniref:Transposase n=1 Tax=Dictyobacter alpinus TaxID=2014873 RepID=A0A402BC82_9CHLR|nr:IS4 family transposase [Dictyobacter alpinus]GCE29018.1 transposase [Dictyobacter alpinus]